ncbi:MAG TPA: DUF427 domain-containing protein [Pseudonocardia sp.]|jgi:uncharacterized protein (DUF427 family)|nr:DUF427 domain-containing protein [Pseudonocardia sp.]
MTLTHTPGPLAGVSQLVNYSIEGPKHRLLMHPFPRRVRAEFAGETLIDTRAGVLVHETGLLPQLYVPEADLRTDLLVATDHSTHCPFKGDASYRSIRVGDRTAENAVWAYREPLPEASWLTGYAAVYWSAPDRWLDEDEEAVGHLPDPFHRVDIRSTGQRVRVLAGDEVLADSRSALVLSETGLPNRFYLPADDITAELSATETRTVCPYKGWASYWSTTVNGREITDVAWGYLEPLPESSRLQGYRSFLHDDVTVEVDGTPV